MDSRIGQALLKLFDKHRIVFWCDVKDELRSDYDALNLPDVTKVELEGNEFSVKYRVLREEPKQKFLIYRAGPEPEPIDNWLLDVQLANTVFSADQAGLWLSEYELDFALASIVHEHAEFHKNKRRRTTLGKKLDKSDSKGRIILKMLAVCAGSDSRLDNILEHLLEELANSKDDIYKLICRCNLDKFLWEQMKCYGYESSTPGVEDFAIELFKSCYAKATDGMAKLNDDAVVFLKRWKDSRRFSNSFEQLSDKYSKLLHIADDLSKRDYRELVETDYFREVDQKIICDLIHAVESRVVTEGDCTLIVRQRRQSYWVDEFRDLYEAIDSASRFMTKLNEAKLEMASLQEGFERYSSSWYLIDQLYRKFIFHVRTSGEVSLLVSLLEMVENLYSNSYLLKLQYAWQPMVDASDEWIIPGAVRQDQFFEKWVRPFLTNKKKVFVIISDGLRYETGSDLLSLIRQEDRYDAEIKPMMSMVPSYTQLGMAALLPHKSIELSVKGNQAIAYVDGQSSQGTANRSTILNAEEGWAAKAITAQELLDMPREGDAGYRALFREHDVVYVYHNRIDATGDKRDTEERVFEATRDALQELVQMIRKLSTANVTNMIVTSDHGYIYQNRAIDESDYLSDEPEGSEIPCRDRRFVIGRELVEGPGFKKFSSESAGLSGDLEMLLPKSINRLRLKGSGSRFVHGGASLQETVIPVIEINKKRTSDLRQVDVDILPTGSKVITSGQLAVALYQQEAVTDKVQPRKLTAALYTSEGKIISDCREISFDLTSENAREREFKVRFILTRDADDFNGETVSLQLVEMIGTTSHPHVYKSRDFTLRRSFTSDFDL